MALHECELYDEVHRIFLLGVNLSSDSQKEIRLRSKTVDGIQTHFLEIKVAGSREVIPIKGVKIPPDTGVDTLAANFAALSNWDV
jgi:hypothetical protein